MFAWSQTADQKRAQFQKHCELFEVARTPAMEVFETAMIEAPSSGLETSYKLKGDHVHGSRFNIFYGQFEKVRDRDCASLWKRARTDIDRFAECTGMTLNTSLLDEVVSDDFDFDKAIVVALGVDLRPEPSACRAKLAVNIQGDPEKVEQLLGLYGHEDVMRPMVDIRSIPELYFAFDFSFDGGTRLKIYPRAHAQEWQSPDGVARPIYESFSEPMRALMDMCLWVHVAYNEGKDGEPGRLVHLHPRPDQTERLIETIGDARLTAAHAPYRDKPVVDRTFTVNEHDVDRGEYDVINGYYFAVL